VVVVVDLTVGLVSLQPTTTPRTAPTRASESNFFTADSLVNVPAHGGAARQYDARPGELFPPPITPRGARRRASPEAHRDARFDTPFVRQDAARHPAAGHFV
jgi:hypothetical protein